MPDRLFTDPPALTALCRRHRIRRLSLFGSVLKGTHRPDSDVDLLVKFEPGAAPVCSASPRSKRSCRVCSADAASICALRTSLAGTSATRSCAPLRCNMPPEDRIRILHMIEATECPTRNEARYLNRLSSPPRKRGSRATVRTLRPWVPAFAGMTDKRLILRRSLWQCEELRPTSPGGRSYRCAID